MVVYLLEKSRLTYQQPLERCYHSFYNLMSDAVPDLKANCLLSNDVRDYHYVSQGKISVPSIDDKEDMQFADEAYDILGFSSEEKYNVYKVSHSRIISVCLGHLSNECFHDIQDTQCPNVQRKHFTKGSFILAYC